MKNRIKKYYHAKHESLLLFIPAGYLTSDSLDICDPVQQFGQVRAAILMVG